MSDATGVHPGTTLGDSDGAPWTNGDETTITTDPNAACGYTAGGASESESS